MNVSPSTSATLQALLRQLDPAAGAATPAAPAKPAAVQAQAQRAQPASPAVTPNGKTQFNPNSPRGTYLNIVV